MDFCVGICSYTNAWAKPNAKGALSHLVSDIDGIIVEKAGGCEKLRWGDKKSEGGQERQMWREADASDARRACQRGSGKIRRDADRSVHQSLNHRLAGCPSTRTKQDPRRSR